MPQPSLHRPSTHRLGHQLCPVKKGYACHSLAVSNRLVEVVESERGLVGSTASRCLGDLQQHVLLKECRQQLVFDFEVELVLESLADF